MSFTCDTKRAETSPIARPCTPDVRRNGSAPPNPTVPAPDGDVSDLATARRERDELFELMPCFATFLTRDLRVARANRLTRETFAAREGDRCYEVFKHRDSACSDCPVMGVLKDGRARVSEAVGIRADGTPIYYVVTTTPVSGDADQVLQLATDVTELKRLEGHLDEARLLRRALIASSHDAILATNETGKIVIFNRAAEALLKLDAGQVLGAAGLDDLLPPETIRALRTADQEVTVQECELHASDGEAIPVRLSGSKIDRGISPPGIAVFLSDLRPIKQLERENLRAARLAAVGQTVAGLAHSIKNVLNGLEGGAYVYRSGVTCGKVDLADRGWEMIERNLGRVSRLVKDLLTLSKTNSLQVSPADPCEIAADVAALFRPAATEAGVELSVELPQQMEPVPLDAEGLHSCLANLVCNALDACRERGATRPCAKIRAWQGGGVLHIEVADNGVGMDEETRKRVLTGWYTSKGNRGNGLGLLIARKIVQDHGGTIDFDSRPGEGTVFRIRIPAT